MRLNESVMMRETPMTTLASFMDSNDYFYGATAVMSTFVGNHDLPRVIHLAADSRIFGDDQGAGEAGQEWALHLERSNDDGAQKIVLTIAVRNLQLLVDRVIFVLRQLKKNHLSSFLPS